MARKAKKPASAKAKAQLKDLRAKKADKVKGGAYEGYVKIEGTKQGDVK